MDLGHVMWSDGQQKGGNDRFIYYSGLTQYSCWFTYDSQHICWKKYDDSWCMSFTKTIHHRKDYFCDMVFLIIHLYAQCCTTEALTNKFKTGARIQCKLKNLSNIFRRQNRSNIVEIHIVRTPGALIQAQNSKWLTLKVNGSVVLKTGEVMKKYKNTAKTLTCRCKRITMSLESSDPTRNV